MSALRFQSVARLNRNTRFAMARNVRTRGAFFRIEVARTCATAVFVYGAGADTGAPADIGTDAGTAAGTHTAADLDRADHG